MAFKDQLLDMPLHVSKVVSEMWSPAGTVVYPVVAIDLIVPASSDPFSGVAAMGIEKTVQSDRTTTVHIERLPKSAQS